MSAEVETMFYLRKEPWHGLGTQVMEAPNSKEALKLAGLDWKVVQEPLITGAGDMVDGYKANVRNTDNQVLGVVGDRYRIVQNEEAFAFTDDLLGYGVRYETAGSLQGGKKVWMLAHMPQEYIIAGEHISPYLLFSNPNPCFTLLCFIMWVKFIINHSIHLFYIECIQLFLFTSL